ncbi:MAG: helix-turn-helix domain-containing protein [Lachnospiraceae bacterium]|nr:helix-turn-helix domain-containing protein [Lachnospiraceae bacterium]
MYKIMLADDEGIVIDSLQFILKKEFGDDCVIESAKTGRSVIELAERFRPDIAIMDIQMPGINGIEAMREIRATNASTIFIIMSAYDKFDYAKEAINLGVLEYLNKPMDRVKIIEVVRRAMRRIDRERDKRSQDLIIREKMETVIPIIENGLVQNLLFQEFFEEDIDNFKKLLGIEADHGYMMALVFGESQEGNHMTNAVGTSVRLQNHAREVREVVKSYFPGVVGSVMANKIAVFVPTENDKFEYNERIELIEKARVMVRKLRQHFDVAFRAGFGSITNLSNAMESYNEALDSLTATTGTVAHVDDLPIGCGYEENYPAETEKSMFDKLEKGDLNGMLASANQFFDWMVENYADCPTDIKLKALEFVLWGEHIAYSNTGRVYQFRSRKEYLPDILSYDNYEQLRKWFTDKLSVSCRNIIMRKEEQSSSVIDKAKDYISARYNKDISLDDVSREVDISPYYFSKIFKEETGENFIEYVTNIRISKAKELLQSSDLSIKEICGEVGYADPNYFSRTFKKNVGVTPTEYKEGKV